MGLFFYNKVGSIISIGDLPTTNIIEPVLSATSKLCFEQPAASFLVCSLIFIEYKGLNTSKKRAFPITEVLIFLLSKKGGSIIFVVGKSPMDIMEPIFV